MRGRLLLTLWLFLGLGLSARAQEGPERWREPARAAGVDPALVEILWARAAAQRWPTEELERLIQTSLSLEREGMPGELLLQKALEGMAKQVPPEQVLRVTEQLAGTLRRAHELLQERVPRWRARLPELEERPVRRAFIAELASGQAQGVPVEVLARALEGWMQARSAPSWRDMLAAVRILPEMPVPPERSAELIQAFLEAGGKGAELNQIPAALRMAQQQMRLPAEAIARMATQRIRGGLSPRELLEHMRRGALERPPMQGMGRPGKPRG
nr:MAG: hypothetical protein KatS3mg041_1426 [Bacteroidota bacterium]